MRNFNRFFVTFLLAYITLILISIFSGILSNRALVREYENHVKRFHLSKLNKTRDIVEDFIEDIKWTTYQLAGNTNLLKLISDENNNLSNMERSLLIRETMNELKKSVLYNTSNNSIFYIYLKNQDLIITPYSVYRHSDFNISTNFFKMEDIPSSEWHKKITDNFHQGEIYSVRDTIIEDFKNKPMIPYIQSIPMDSKNSLKEIEGAIVYLIGETDFINFLKYEDLPEGAYSYISDEDNNIITSVSGSPLDIQALNLTGKEGMINKVLDKEKKFIIHTYSEKNNWRYVSVLPERWVLKNVRFYNLLSIVVMSISLIICLVIAYRISRRWSKPIETSFSAINDFLETENIEKESFQTLSLSVNRLIDRGEIIQDQLLNQQSFLHNAFVNRLINGFFNNEISVERYLSQLGFTLNEESFSVALLSIDNIVDEGSTESFDEFNRVKNIVKNRLQQDFPYRVMLSEQDNSDLVLIVLSEDTQTHLETLKIELEQYIKSFPPLYRDNLIIGLGSVVTSLLNIHKSYIEAKEIISIEHSSHKPLVLSKGDIDQKIEDYYFPIEIENRLINTLKSGNIKSLKNLLLNIEQENFYNRKLNTTREQNLILNLTNSLYRVKNQLNPQNIEILDKNENIEFTNFQNISNLLINICEQQDKSKKSHNNKLLDDVKEFLKNNYNDKNLTLYSVGDNFSITESYLSFFFKEQSGENFSVYLERLRIDKAKEILTITTHPIHTVAQMVGYNSDKTFRRAFQKLENISPSKFRKDKKLEI